MNLGLCTVSTETNRKSMWLFSESPMKRRLERSEAFPCEETILPTVFRGQPSLPWFPLLPDAIAALTAAFTCFLRPISIAGGQISPNIHFRRNL